MNTHELSLTEKALDLYKMKKKRPAAFIEKPPKRPVGRPVKRETILKILRKTTADINAPEQLQLLARQLTGGGQGMKLKEFRYYPYPGNPYGNPEDFAKEREKERRGGMIKAGLIGAGLLGGGALVGRGLFKAGISTAARRADDLERELVKARSAKPASAPDVSAPDPKPRGRPKSETPPPPPPQVEPPPPPTPPPQPPPSNADRAILNAGKKNPSVAPTAQAVENLQKSGAISNADAAAEVQEALAAAKGAKAPAVPKTPAVVKPKAPAAPKTPAVVKTKAAPATPPPASATNEDFWQGKGQIRVPLTGSPAERAAFRQQLNDTDAADGFKGQTVADVIEQARERARQSLKPPGKSDFPPGLSDKLRAASKENNPQPKKKNSRKKNQEEGEDDPGASAEEEAWEKGLAGESGETVKKPAAKSKGAGSAVKKTAAKKTKASESSIKGVLPNLSNLTPAQRRAIQAKARERRKKKSAPNAKGKKAAVGGGKKQSARRVKEAAAVLRGVREFNFQTDEGGIPFTGKVAKDRFIKKLRDEDLDRRDANILRAGATGALAGLLFRGRLSAGKRALIGAGIGGAGVIGTRMATDRTRDIYGERSRGAKRAEALPALAGLGAAGWLATRRIRGLAAKIRGVRLFNHRGHRGHGGVKEFSILNKISNLTGMAQIKAGREALEKARWSRKHALLASPMRLDGGPAYGVRKFPHAREATREARRLIDEGVRRRNISIGVGAGVAGLGAGAGYLATRKESNLAAKLRGLKEFDDYRLYYFKGRNTGIAARSAEEARKKKKRGGDELVAVRTPSATEKSQMSRGIWVRTRRDGKSPGQSRYGKGRGQGPARKSMGAKLRGVKEFGKVAAAAAAGGIFAAAGGLAWHSHNKRKANRQKVQNLMNSPFGQALVNEVGRQKIAESLRARGHHVVLAPKSMGAKIRVKFFEKKKEKKTGGLNPYVGAALSGFGSGAALGSLALLRRGATFRSAAKTAAKLGIASAGIVGGGALLGSKIIGNPRDDESAPFTKRAAIGGAIVGSGAGLAGALLLRKTKGGARALVGASKKTEPFSRPAMWLRKTPLVGAAGIGAVGGALYGGAMGADEGQQVDSIRNLRKDIKAMSRRLRLVKLFGTREQARWDGGEGDSSFANTGWGWATDRPMYVPSRDTQGRVRRDIDGNTIRQKWDPSSGQLWNSVAREAQKQRVTVQRGGRLTRDLVDEMRGAERRRDASGRIKKREWEKSWFQNKATEIGMAAAGIGGLAAVRYANNNPDTKMGRAWINTQKSANATRKNARDIGQAMFKTVTNITARRRFAAKLGRLKELDAMAEYYGWDVRDPRGRSARVFAPGSRRRERRQKEWHEKTENERKLWKAGLVASALGGAGALLVGQRLVSGKSLIPSRFIKKPIDPSVFTHTPPTAKQADEILKNWKTP